MQGYCLKEILDEKMKKYLRKQLGQSVNKDELLAKIANNELRVTGLISKR